MIKLIYHLYVNKLMGYRKITDYLNAHGFRTRDGKEFVISTIKRILENPIYIGRKRYKTSTGGTQPFNNKLQIISEELYYQAEQIRNTRRSCIKKQDKTGIPRSGKLLFSGLAYCKYCCSKLTTNYLYRTSKRKNGTYKNVIYRYRCPLNKGSLHCNHEQNIWGGKKYDTLILNKIKVILSHFELQSFLDSSKNMKSELLRIKERNIQNLKKELSDLEKQHNRLKLEIGKALLGESTFTPEQLSDVITELEKQIEEKSAQIQTLNKELVKERENYSDVNYLGNKLENWEQKFNEADEHLKKAMLSRVINKVYLGKNEIEIELNIWLSDYFEGRFD